MLTLPPLSLYVHLPWCVRKCPYCDFNSHEARGPLPFAAYVDALIADLDYDLPLVSGRKISTVFFGGGTPSLFPPNAIDAFLQAASARLAFEADCEITLETNPGTAEHGRFEDYRRAGVNRISFGIQSFDDGCLARLGRIHDGAQAESAIKMAQDAGLSNLNFDLMYALPQQTTAMAECDVAHAIALQPAHVSHYQLTLEPNTVFAVHPPAGIPDHDASWHMFERCQALLAAAGFVQYEVSAYARPGRACAHNLNYWNFGDYLGVGAGAHGKLTLIDPTRDEEPSILRRWKLKHPASYLAHAGTHAAIGGDERIEGLQRAFDFMLNALRLNAGFCVQTFQTRTGLALDAIAGPLEEAITHDWVTHERDGNGIDRIVPTELGRRFTNDVISLFLDD